MLCYCCFRVRSASGKGQLYFALNQTGYTSVLLWILIFLMNEQTKHYFQLRKYEYVFIVKTPFFFFLYKEITVSMCTFSRA